MWCNYLCEAGFCNVIISVTNRIPQLFYTEVTVKKKKEERKKLNKWVDGLINGASDSVSERIVWPMQWVNNSSISYLMDFTDFEPSTFILHSASWSLLRCPTLAVSCWTKSCIPWWPSWLCLSWFPLGTGKYFCCGLTASTSPSTIYTMGSQW